MMYNLISQKSMGAFFHSKNSTTPLKRSLLCHVTYLPVLDILLYKTQIDHSLVISHPICIKLDSKKGKIQGYYLKLQTPVNTIKNRCLSLIPALFQLVSAIASVFLNRFG